MTQKKLILMALMGVMLSDAEAAPTRPSSKRPASASRGGSRRGSARGAPKMTMGEPKGGSAFEEVDNGGTDPEPTPAPNSTEKKDAPEATQPVAQKPDYKAERAFGEVAQRAFGVSAKDILENFMKKALGVDNLNDIKGLRNKLDGFVALGESDAKLKDNLMTGTMLGVLDMAKGKKLKDVTVETTQNANAALKISVGGMNLNIAAGAFGAAGRVAFNTNTAQNASDALNTLAETKVLADFFNAFSNIGLLVGDEIKKVGLDEFDANTFKKDMSKILEKKGAVEDDAFKANKGYPIKASFEEYVNDNWVKPLFDNIKKHVDGDKPVFAMYVDVEGDLTPGLRETFGQNSNVKNGMRFTINRDANNGGLLNLVRIKKGENTIFNVDPVSSRANSEQALEPSALQIAANRAKSAELAFDDILADKKGRQALEEAQNLLSQTPKLQVVNNLSAFIAKLTDLYNEDKAVKKVENAKNEKDKKAAEKALNKDFVKIMTNLVDKAATAAKGPGRFETKAEEGAIG